MPEFLGDMDDDNGEGEVEPIIGDPQPYQVHPMGLMTSYEWWTRQVAREQSKARGTGKINNSRYGA